MTQPPIRPPIWMIRVDMGVGRKLYQWKCRPHIPEKAAYALASAAPQKNVCSSSVQVSVLANLVRVDIKIHWSIWCTGITGSAFRSSVNQFANIVKQSTILNQKLLDSLLKGQHDGNMVKMRSCSAIRYGRWFK